MSHTLSVEISPGELIDKITILAIKLDRISDADKLKNIRLEYDTLTGLRDSAIPGTDQLTDLTAELKSINQTLWRIEDDIRDCERAGEFGDTFVKLARSVYITNDSRMAVKRRINDYLGSRLVEEKPYAAY
ncbi:MAG TPA: hypothetical protein ENI69_03190 [Rhodospirillales bacterium]|nr:hypothetical protein [Rhodospirillales bacterium]